MSRIPQYEKVVCDLCGKDITDQMLAERHPYEIKVTRRTLLFLKTEVYNYDICTNCWNELKFRLMNFNKPSNQKEGGAACK